MKRIPSDIVAHPLFGILLVVLCGGANTSVQAVGAHFPSGGSEGVGCAVVVPGHVFAEPEPLDAWWALLNLWISINCQIVVCEGEVDPLMPLALAADEGPIAVITSMKAQIERYYANGIRSGLTEEQKQIGIQNLDQTALVLLDHPEEIPSRVCDDYMLMIVNAIKDLEQ